MDINKERQQFDAIALPNHKMPNNEFTQMAEFLTQIRKTLIETFDNVKRFRQKPNMKFEEWRKEEQMQVIEDVLAKYTSNNPFLKKGADAKEPNKEHISETMYGFIQHCNTKAPDTEIMPRYSIENFTEYTKNMAAHYDKVGNAKGNEEDLNKANSMQDITKKVEKAEDNFKKDLSFYQTVVGILGNSLDGSSHPPDTNMYYWACQQLKHAEPDGLKYQINELNGKQEISFAVKFPGIAETTFKTICFQNQRQDINKISVRSNEELHSTMRYAEKGDAVEVAAPMELSQQGDDKNTPKPIKPISKDATELSDGETQHPRFVKLKEALRYDRAAHEQKWLSLEGAREIIASAVMSVHDIQNMIGKEEVQVKEQESELSKK